MFSRLLIISSALFLAMLGVLTLFAPDKVLSTHGTTPDNATVLLIQMMGALYLGFAFLNWQARAVLIGGIYSRPVAAGNFLHFTIVGLLLAKSAWQFSVLQLAASALVFSLFAVGFGVVLFVSKPASD